MKKKIVIIIMILLVLYGCASSSSAAPEPVQAADESEPFNNTIEVMPDDEDTTADILPEEDKYEYQDKELTFGFDDFGFYEEGVPEDVNYPSLKYAEGEWKYDLRFREETFTGYYFDELGYAVLTLDYDRETVKIVLHPKLGSDGFELWDESDETVGYEPFEGGFDENDELRLLGNNAVLYPEYYYAYEGREYFISSLWLSEEEYGMLLMFRGQN